MRVLDETTGEECPRAAFDASGRLLNHEAVGQIVAKGLAHTFEGYYRNPAAHAERVRGTDFWSGDLAYRDTEGFFYFAGRASDWLRVDSENFAAAQVERVLQRHLSVAEDLNNMPLNDPIGTLVLGSDPRSIHAVFIAGQVRKWAGTVLDLTELRQDVHASRDRVLHGSQVAV